MTSIIKVDNIQNTSGDNIINESSGTITVGASGDTISIPSGATITNSGTATGFGGGKIGQVISVAKTDSFSTTATSDTAVTGCSVSITPSATSSKIYVMFTGVSESEGSGTYLGSISLYRDSTRLVGGQAGVSAFNNVSTQSSLSFLDSPNSTSSLTYGLRARSEGNNSTTRINHPTAVVEDEKAVLTVMEVLA